MGLVVGTKTGWRMVLSRANGQLASCMASLPGPIQSRPAPFPIPQLQLCVLNPSRHHHQTSTVAATVSIQFHTISCFKLNSKHVTKIHTLSCLHTNLCNSVQTIEHLNMEFIANYLHSNVQTSMNRWIDG